MSVSLRLPAQRRPSRLLRDYVALVRRSDVALVYAAILLGVAIVLAVAPQSWHDQVVLKASTNLDNLRDRPWAVLVASVFVCTSLGGLWQLPIILAAYASAQRWVGRAGTIFAAALGHVGATLLVAVALVSGIAHNRLSNDLAHVTDVGYSYALACLAAFLVSRVPRWLMPLYLLYLLSYVAPAFWHTTFTDVGHITALALGFGLALVVARAGRADRRAAQTA